MSPIPRNTQPTPGASQLVASGERADHAAFSPFDLVAVPGQHPCPTKLVMVEIGRGRGIGEVASQRADAVFPAMVET
jgi:hypothetical protein